MPAKLPGDTLDRVRVLVSAESGRGARAGAAGPGVLRAGAAGPGVLRPTPASLHNVSMPNVLVRDVSEEVHAALARRAELRGQSLQQYLAAELRRLAERPSMQEVLDRIGRHRGGRVGLGRAAQDLAEERSGR